MSGLAAAAEAVLAANDAFYTALNAKDFGAMDALWAREVPVACVHPNWNALAGRECVMESWRAILDNPEQPRVFMGAAEAHLLDTVAYVLCRELVAGGALTATNVFTQEDGEWRLTLHHSSPVSV